MSKFGLWWLSLASAYKPEMNQRWPYSVDSEVAGQGPALWRLLHGVTDLPAPLHLQGSPEPCVRGLAGGAHVFSSGSLIPPR